MRDRNPRPCFSPQLESLEAREVPAASALDTAYVVHAVQGDVQEILIGFEAMKHASTPAAWQFGNILVQDHYAALVKLLPIAAAEGIQLQWLTRDQQDNVDHFAHERGSQFDRDLASFMVQDHQQDIALANMVAATSTDPKIKAYAQQTIPTLQFHYQIALLENQMFNHGRTGFTGNQDNDQSGSNGNDRSS